MIEPQARARLCEWLAREAGAASVAMENVAALGGGAISQNIAVDLAIEGGPLAGRHECVLRAASPAGVAASLTKPQEFAVLRAAFAAGMAAPEPLFVSDDPAVFERPFYIMRRALGIGAGRLITKAEEPQDELARELGRQLARLHAITPGAPGLDFLIVPDSPGLAAAGLYRQWLGEEARRDPVIAWGLRWLERNAPPPGEIVLSHRDYRTGNYLVDDGRLTAVLDWEFCGWSDPMEDVAWFCSRSWRFARPEREAGGIAARAPFYAGYEEASGRRIDPARIAFWETSAYLRWAAIAWQQAQRHASGIEPSLELALTGRMLPEILNDMLIHLESLEKGTR
jgi:aminoglycoside phosphotransferase (APT) family kinase protein